MSESYEEMYVKETQEIRKIKDGVEEITYKAILEKTGESGSPKIVITSDVPIDLNQGDKGVKISIKNTQTKLNV